MATGTILTIAAIGSAVIGAGAAIMQGIQAKDAADAEADQLESQAQQERLKASAEEVQRLRRARFEIGSAIVNAAVNNVDIDFSQGSFSAIFKEEQKLAKEDTRAIRLFGKAAAGAAQTSANTARARGKNALTAGLLGGAKAASTGFSDVEATGAFDKGGLFS